MSKRREVSVLRLIGQATEYLRGRGYAKETVELHRCRWRRFARYAQRQKEQWFSLPLVKRFLKTLPSDRGRPPKHRIHPVRHSMRILSEFAASGRHVPRAIPIPPPLPVTFGIPIADALAFAERECGWAKSTVSSRSAWVIRFVRHVIARRRVHAWKDIAATDLSAFLVSLQIGRGSRATVHACIKAMFRILFIQGILSAPLHEQMPPLARSCEAQLSTIWSPAELQAVLAMVDRNAAIGKRNYAILLLAMRMGLRPCDIRNLRLDDIGWEQSRIQIVQQKTKMPLILPLLPEIGDALIDYLRNGRPHSQFRQVFLRHYAPREPLRKCRFYYMLETYRKKAGLPKRRAAGLGSLRHSLATRMLEDGTSVETIAGVLGHTCVETTNRYIRVTPSLLRKATLDPDKEVAHA